jgi:hypothetical protein
MRNDHGWIDSARFAQRSKMDTGAHTGMPLRSPVVNGPALLEHAAGLVNRRRREYGEPVELFEQIAQRWSLTLGTRVSPAQVTLCLIDLKLARLAHDPKHLDSQIDLAGYTACLREVTQ